MFSKKSPLTKTTDVAADVLKRFGDIEAAIQREVDGLQPHLTKRLAAEQALLAVETEVALGTPGANTTLAKAQKQLDEARAAVDAVARKLLGLRTAAAAMGAELSRAWDSLNADLSTHREQVKADFAAEWAAAVATFAAVLGKRAALEQFLEERLALPTPEPTPVELGLKIRQPREQADALARAVRSLASKRGDARANADERSIGLNETFQMLKDRHGLPAGALVASCSLDPGRLEGAVAAGWARPARNPEAHTGLHEAERAARRIAATEASEVEARRLAEQKALQARRQAEDEARDPDLRKRNEEARREREQAPTVPKITITPAAMYPDSPARREEFARAAHMNPPPGNAQPEHPRASYETRGV